MAKSDTVKLFTRTKEHKAEQWFPGDEERNKRWAVEEYGDGTGIVEGWSKVTYGDWIAESHDGESTLSTIVLSEDEFWKEFRGAPRPISPEIIAKLPDDWFEN